MVSLRSCECKQSVLRPPSPRTGRTLAGTEVINIMSVSSLILILLLGLTSDGNPTVVVRADHSRSEWPQSLLAFLPAGELQGTLGQPVASDLSFERAGGNHPTLHVFSADIEGDGSDEIVLARMKQYRSDTDLQVRIYEPPLVTDGSTGKYVASSKQRTLGSPVGDGRILLMGALDLEGDGKDECFVIREWGGGAQIRKLPRKRGHGKMKQVLAMDAAFGLINLDPNVSATGADVNGDGVSELVVLRRAVPGGVDRLLVFEPPTTLDGDTGAPILSDEDITPSGNGTNLGISRTDIDGDGRDELILRRQYPLQGSQALEVYAFPDSVNGEIGAPLFVDPHFIPPGSNASVPAVFGLRGYTARPPTPPDSLDGTYTALMSHTADGQAELMPPLGDLIAPQTSPDTFVINLPTFNPLVGSYSREGARVDFGTNLNKLKIVSNGDVYWLVYGVAQVSLSADKVVISGSYSGFKDPTGGPNQTITEGAFTFTQR